MGIGEMKERLERTLLPKRYRHSLNVAQTAKNLAKIHHMDQNQAYLAGLLHDCGKGREAEYQLPDFPYSKDIPKEEFLFPSVVHEKLGAILAKEEYGVDDPEILSAISCHSTGKADMSDLDKIIYLADMLEPNRDFPGIERLRQQMSEDLSNATLLALNFSLQYLLEKGECIHPDSVRARNDLLRMR